MIKDLHASDQHRFDAAVEGGGGCGGRDREIWLGGNENTDDLLVDDALLYGGDFPPLPDFPCMSSSSSTSSTPAPVKPMTSSCSSATSSSAASWAVLKSDAEEDRGRTADVGSTQAAAALSSTASMEFSQPPDRDCMDVMESFEYMDLIENSNDFFDPCSLFQHDYPPEDFEVPDLKVHNNQDQEQFTSADGYYHQQQYQDHGQDQFMVIPSYDEDKKAAELTQLGDQDDLGAVFLDWLKNNKETVCAEDLRKVKIKKATIECAAKRLGGGKEAMKQLLKLILEWVQSNHLQKRRINAGPDQDPQFQNPNPNPVHQEPNSFSWNVSEPPTYDPTIGYIGDPYSNVAAGLPPQHPVAHMLDSAQTWPPSQFALQAPVYNSFPDQNHHLHHLHPHQFMSNQYNQYQYVPGNGEKLARLGSSATKEARKKRMARQRRLFRSHHHHHNNTENISQQNQAPDQLHARPGVENWMCHWPAGLALPLPVDGHKASLDRPGTQWKQNDRRQGWKPEKNLRFLLQKVLKQSDVGNLGRIVLPKKEAETHLPELEARDGIAISMEDIGTSRVWNMRYRFWPNNKSRMYLLENTGDFVRTNGLQEGDFIVIYSDVKCGKYLIRGVKVRQPGPPKSETKRPAKSQRNQLAASPAGNGSSSSSPITQATKLGDEPDSDSPEAVGSWIRAV